MPPTTAPGGPLQPPCSPRYGATVDVIDAADALDLVGGGLAPEELGPFSGVPALFVRTTDPGTAARCAALLRRLPCVAVAVDDAGATPSDLDDFDVLLTVRS